MLYWICPKLIHVIQPFVRIKVALNHESKNLFVILDLSELIDVALLFVSQVSVNTDKYDVLKFWALGREKVEPPLSLTTQILNTILRRPAPKRVEYYKRVVAAVRLKRDDKLLLKAFKEVPVDALSKLVPDGNVKMSKVDRGVLMTSGAIALTSILAKVVTILAHVHVDWTLIVTGVMGLAGVQAWTVHKNNHLAYVNDLTRMLYFKNIANNRGLLTLLIDRAEDELFKETILAYTFLLTNRAPSTVKKDPQDVSPKELGKSALETKSSRCVSDMKFVFLADNINSVNL